MSLLNSINTCDAGHSRAAFNYKSMGDIFVNVQQLNGLTNTALMYTSAGQADAGDEGL